MNRRARSFLFAVSACFALFLGMLAASPAQASADAIVTSSDCAQHDLPANDDGSSSLVTLPFYINLYGTMYSSLFVNNNGNVTFNQPLETFTPFGLLSATQPIIAPFFADVDTRGSGSVQYGETTYEGHPALCVSWLNVGYYAQHNDKLDSFQLLLVSRPEAGVGSFDIVFNYGAIAWETGDDSGGEGGLGGYGAARVGFSAGSGLAGTSTELPGSGVAGSFLDSSPAGLAKTSLGSSVQGRYVFPVRAGGVADKYVALGDSFQSGQGAYSYDEGSDTSANQCHRSSNAYPHLLVNDQVVRLTLNFRACAGATIHDMLLSSNGFNPPYDDGIAQIDALGPDTRLVTVGIVGNDLKFSDTITDCVKLSAEIFNSDYGNWGGSCNARLGSGVDASVESLESGQLHSDLLNLYRLIRALAPYAQVIPVTYPEFFPQGGSGAFGCSGIVRHYDQQWMNDEIRRADLALEVIAMQAGYQAVDMSDVFSGHEQCTSNPAMNGIIYSPPIGAANESYHPNAYGHRLMANRIEDRVNLPSSPTFSIFPQQTVDKTFTVTGKTFTVNVAWPGSDVETTLISPSGVRYTRQDPGTAIHGSGPTFEYFEVDDPEPGQWTVSSYGLDVSASGEPVTMTAVDETPLDQAPSAKIAISGSGTSYTFDGSASVDTDGTIADYSWDFGDGTTGTGATIQHTFARPGSYAVTLTTTDNQGAHGFSSGVQNVNVPTTGLAVHSGANTTLSDQFAVTGPDANVYVAGDFTCDGNTHVQGDVTASGAAHITTSCHIDGNLWAGGDILIDGAPTVAGSVTTPGSVALQSTAHIGGDLTAGSTFTSLNGTSVDDLKTAGVVGGTITANASVAAPTPTVFPSLTVVDSSSWTGFTSMSWSQWMNATAAANNAPSWSAGRTTSPGCTMSPNGNSVGGTTAAIVGNVVMDARGSASGCSVLALQGMTLQLSGDLVLYADSFQSVNGLAVHSADGQPHTLRVLVPGTQPNCGSASHITLSPNTSIDPLITTQLYAPGQVSINGPTSLTGQIEGGCVSASGTVTVVHAPVLTPGHS